MLPDVDQVREHEPRGGLWRHTCDEGPEYVLLRVGGLRPHVLCCYAPANGQGWFEPYGNWPNTGTWTPCTTDGDPLHLVERVAELEARLAPD